MNEIATIDHNTQKCLTLTEQGRAALESSMHWLQGWHAVEPIPTKQISTISAQLQIAQQACSPSDIKAFSCIIDGLFTFAESFGLAKIPTDNAQYRDWASQRVQIYHDALSDVPVDLLVLAIKRVKASHAYRNLPLPADIRAQIAEELAERTCALNRLKRAADVAKRQATTEESSDVHSQEAKERVAALCAAWRAGDKNAYNDAKKGFNDV